MSFSLGITPASDSLVAFTNTMTFIVASGWLNFGRFNTTTIDWRQNRHGPRKIVAAR